MKYLNSDWVRAVAVLACLTGGLAWSAHARADDEAKPTLVAVRAPEQVVRLPALRVGGIRSGEVLMITESGAERMKATMMALRQMQKPSPFSDFCTAH